MRFIEMKSVPSHLSSLLIKLTATTTDDDDKKPTTAHTTWTAARQAVIT